MSLAVLSIDLVAQLASLQSGMDKAGRIAERQASQIEARFSKMGAIASGVGTALGAALSVVGLTQLLRATLEGVEALDDLSDATGASIENISALEDIAARTGTSMSTVGDALIRLNKVLSDANPNTPMAQALKAIGLNAAELRKLDPAEALRRTAEALAGYADDGAKARLVQELFGKSTREVASLLKDLSEAGRLNGTLTAEQARETKAFNRELAAFSKNMVDGARAVTGEMLPALNQFFERARGLKKAGGFFKFVGLEVDANLASDRLRVVTDEMERLQAYMDRQGKPSPVLAIQMSNLRLEADKLTRDALAASAALKGFADIGAPLANGRRPANEGGGGLLSRNLPEFAPATIRGSNVKEFISNSFDQATIAALRAMEATDANKLRELNLALSGLFELQRETRGDPVVVQAIAKVRAEIEALTNAPVPDPGPTKAYADALAALGGTSVAQIREVSAALDELFKMRDVGLDSPELEAAIQALSDKLAELKKPLSEVNAFAQEAGRNIQDALGDSVLKALEGNTNDIATLWQSMLNRLIAQTAAAELGKLLLGDYAKTGTMGGWAGELSKLISGMGTRADGGPVSAGRPYLVGERGPEIVVPRRAGTVLPNGVAPSVSRPVYLTVNMQGGSASQSTALQAGEAIGRQVRLALARNG